MNIVYSENLSVQDYITVDCVITKQKVCAYG